MGRWAQRTRGGGGVTALIEMTNAVNTPLVDIVITYSGAVDANAFGLADFTSSPSGVQPDSIDQVTNNTIRLNVSSDSTGDDEIQYLNSNPNVRSPQQLQY